MAVAIPTFSSQLHKACVATDWANVRSYYAQLLSLIHISASALAKEKGARRCLPLKVSGPFHTPLMAPAGDALAELFRTVEFREPQIPVIFNLSLIHI